MIEGLGYLAKKQSFDVQSSSWMVRREKAKSGYQENYPSSAELSLLTKPQIEGYCIFLTWHNESKTQREKGGGEKTSLRNGKSSSSDTESQNEKSAFYLQGPKKSPSNSVKLIHSSLKEKLMKLC